MRASKIALAPLALLLPAALAATPAPPAAPGCAFKVQLAEAGAYRLDFESLVAAGNAEKPPVEVKALPSANLQMTWKGTPLPIWVEDGGDGRFGPGDHVEWLGDQLHGEKSFFDELTRLNVYRLDGCAPAGKAATTRMKKMPAFVPAPAAKPAALVVEHHLEQDSLLLRFSKNVQVDENWYWAKMTQIDEQPFVLPINLRHYDRDAGPLRIVLDLRGWSHKTGAKHGLPDHQIEILLNDKSLGTYTSEGQDALKIELPPIGADQVQGGINKLAIKVPVRKAPDGNDLVDAMLLNWIELSFPRRQLVDGHQDFRVTDAKSSHLVTLRTKAEEKLVVLDGDGRRWQGNAIRSTPGAAADSPTKHELLVPAGLGQLTVVPAGTWRQPAGVELDQPSDWLARKPQTDYLMIVHPTLRASIDKLAEFHRGRGLQVGVIDVRDVYDEANHGLRHPRAIRDFLERAWREWPAPQPRWVLLVGDASWDPRADQASDANYADWTYQPGEVNAFIKNGSDSYANAGQVQRDLIPAWPERTSQGHAASDNYFVAFEGIRLYPDMAIGRLPVVTPAEVDGIVGKIIRYATAQAAGAEVADWQRSAVFITNEEAHFKRHSDNIADPLADRLAIHKVYPESNETSNESHTAGLRQALDQGTLLVHFFGHGGRYIWRTGPPDYRKNHDLFTLEDLEKLAPTDHLPMVLSMTCYSGPFDHPTADSIGEKFLRLEDRGAIAVLAASWRNSPTAVFSSSLIDALLTPKTTIGEAVLKAKRLPTTPRDCIEQYNLFGDPALVLAAPPPPPPATDSAEAEKTEPSLEKTSSP